ncbi:MAG: acetyl-CoA carboxylase carboxyltransferase subunit alpha [Candidatus Hydrogenedentes bacterium]|nr:acetyl-CoA carboxylase carboxyltransferase subunit alpha [Candidatus Hydrogenedentota bacterium]
MQIKRAKKSNEVILPFEQPLFDIEQQIAKAESEEARQELMTQRDQQRDVIFSKITPWERVQLARHPQRPRMRSFVERVFEDFVELHGDKALGDDPAMVCGIARFQGRTVFVVGQQKGVDTDEKVKCNFGMAHPEGYRKALRIFRMAERLGHPVVTFVDTPAAHPGIDAEQHGQGFAIAFNLLEAFRINTPILCIILSEGGSGGALAIAVGDHIAMFENAVYVICPPERCAEILWRDVEKKELAASALRVSASDLKSLGVIDSVLKEPNGGAHRDLDGAARSVSAEIEGFLDAASKGEWTLAKRQERFQRLGQWLENVESDLAPPTQPVPEASTPIAEAPAEAVGVGE